MWYKTFPGFPRLPRPHNTVKTHTGEGTMQIDPLSYACSYIRAANEQIAKGNYLMADLLLKVADQKIQQSRQPVNIVTR